MAAVTVTATATARRAFSIPHLNAAKHFADQLKQHELAHVGAGWGPHFDFCTWYATAAIILSFSAIEAAMDEAEDDLAIPSELSAIFERAATLDRAQAILAHRGRSSFERGTEPFQSADLVRLLRNGLVHPKAEWDHDRQKNAQLSRRIVGANLELSPFQTDPDLAFPHGCMSASVAQWAASSAKKFISEFRVRLSLPKTV